MHSILVLGAGMVGQAIARDLAKNHKVTSADLNKTALKKLKEKDDAIQTMELDVTNHEALSQAVSSFDLVVCAVPGFLGFATLKTLIQSGKDVVDISFFPENALDLDYLAKKNNVKVIVDCGVAPGMDNILLGYHDKKMAVESFECLVGGLPKVRQWPFEYKAPFSPIDVIEEYTRPARYVENGEVITRPALSERELLEFENIGTLEAFNTDGLRSLIHTMHHIPNMKEKTLRYPGHAEYIRVLAASGFFSEDEIEIKGVKISPLQFVSRVLFREWKLGSTEEEFTVMRVTIEGNENGKQKRYVYHLNDVYDKDSGVSSMARTTGYTATAAVNYMLDGHFDEVGIHPPEILGAHGNACRFILDYLKDRGVRYRKEEITLNS